MERAILDCGHDPSPHGPHTTGTARLTDGREVCWSCSNAREQAGMHASERYTGYLHVPADEKQAEATRAALGRIPATIQTWPGGFLARVTYLHRGRHNIGGSLYRFRAVDSTGAEWYGTSPGPGMYAKMRRAKSKLR